MKVGLIDVDGHNFPNLALLKISAWHKAKGDSVELITPLEAKQYDQTYASKVFSWSQLPTLPDNCIIGGSGYDKHKDLPEEIEHTCPDYNLYPLSYEYDRTSFGFLTRGCISNPGICPECIVPEKEGKIRPHADIGEFARHKEVTLLDNNVLSCDWGIQQIEKIAKLGLKVDFNQGLDARLIDDSVAKLLSKVKWHKPVRLALDRMENKDYVLNAVQRLRWRNVTPMAYSCYVLIKDNKNDAIERIRFLKGIGVDPFPQPYRNPQGDAPKQWQKDLARYVNHKATFKSVWIEDYKP